MQKEKTNLSKTFNMQLETVLYIDKSAWQFTQSNAFEIYEHEEVFVYTRFLVCQSTFINPLSF